MGDYRDLAVYQRALALGERVHAAAAGRPSFDRWTIGQQAARAAGSIGANIAEAEGRWHRNDRRRLLFIARGSLNETRHCLELATSRGLASKELQGELDHL